MQIKNGRVLEGDNLILMQQLIDEGVEVDLIYVDPPYGIKIDNKFGMPSWNSLNEPKNRVDEIINVGLLCSKGECNYLRWLYPRLVLMRKLLSEKGSLYLHIDWHLGHYVKLLLDDIFGKENFRNEIVWYYTGVTPSPNGFQKKHDIIYRYSNTNNFIFYPQYIPYKGLHVTKVVSHNSNKIANKYDTDKLLQRGKAIEDWWVDIYTVDRVRSEMVGYATQKPEAL